MANPNLTVILGAGASAGSTFGSGFSWTPPLTKEIFDRNNFKPIADKFEVVKGLSAGLSDTLKKDGSSIEAYLKNEIGTHSQYANLKPYRKRQLNQLPLYLQAIFSHVSTVFGRDSLYTRFVASIFDKDIKVTFITLNYDLLLDYALEDISGIKLNDFPNFFVDQPRWVYLKPHGSVNWFRKVKNYAQTGNNLDSWKALVDNLDITKDLEDEISLLDLRKEFVDGYVGNMPYYPALAIPNSEYVMYYPVDDLKKILESRLNECSNYLLVGFSAYDSDLLNMLRDNVKEVKELLIVGNKHTEDTYSRLTRVAPIFARDKPIKSQYGSGFATFINTSDFSNFLNEL